MTSDLRYTLEELAQVASVPERQIRELMPELNAVAMPLVRAVEYSDERSRIEQDVARPNHASVAPVISAYPD